MPMMHGNSQTTETLFFIEKSVLEVVDENSLNKNAVDKIECRIG